jgi:hypothetical protein
MATVKILNYGENGEPGDTVLDDKIVKSDAEWRQQLTPEQYQVTRGAGTEMCGTGEYNHNHNKEYGIYRCVCCDTALFTSRSSSNQEPDGPVSGSQSPWKTSRTAPITPTVCIAPRRGAPGAVRTSDTSLTTVRGRRVCATA